MTVEKRKVWGLIFIFLAAIFGGISMVERGSVRPGRLMIIAGGIGFCIFLWGLIRKQPPTQKEGAS
ncbi:MAG: hypothetical protein HY033_00930 [Ignavibacteriae bacterium]|nr:hypothetical protein [Ignavibacteria bacterium]MBI3363453.1 hypothetical protein [Ignavibacteriota bacterium]